MCASRVDVVFVIDASGSISFEHFRRILDFVSQLVARITSANDDPSDPRTRVSILAYSDEPDPIMFLNDFEMARDLQLRDVMPERARTNTHLALEYARDVMLSTRLGNRPAVVDRIVVISDGESTDPRATQSIATSVRTHLV